MSVTKAYEIKAQQGDGVNKIFRFSFYVNNIKDVRVKIINTIDKTIKELVYGTDFKIELLANYYNGARIVLELAPKTYEQVVIYRKTPIEQEINFKSLQAISPSNLTNIFDKFTIITQENRTQIDQSVKFDLEAISKVDQTKPINEENIKKLDLELNPSKAVALTLKYNETTEKWELYTSKTDPDNKRDQGTEKLLGIYKIATQEEVTEGSNNNKVITPDKLKTEFNRRQATDINTTDTHVYTNPTQVRDYVASKTIVAIQEEVTSGTNDSKIITPSTLKTEFNRRQATDINTTDTHVYTNPTQVRDYVAEKVVIATDDDVNIGTDTNKLITPSTLKTEFERRQATDISTTDTHVYTNPTQVRDYVAEKVVIATDDDVNIGTNDSKIITPLQLNKTILPYSSSKTYTEGEMCYQIDTNTFKPYIYYSLTSENLNNPLTDISFWKTLELGAGAAIATQEEVTLGLNDEKTISPLKLKNELDARIATATEVNNADDVMKYVTPRQVKNYIDDNIIKLKGACEINYLVEQIEFKNLDYNQEHVFIMWNLYGSQSVNNNGENVTIFLGDDSGYRTTSNYWWSSCMRRSNYDACTLTHGTNHNLYPLNLLSDRNTGLKGGYRSQLELHLYPSFTTERYITSTFHTFGDGIVFYETKTSGFFRENGSIMTKLVFTLSNSTRFRGGFVRHYVIKRS